MKLSGWCLVAILIFLFTCHSKKTTDHRTIVFHHIDEQTQLVGIPFGPRDLFLLPNKFYLYDSLLLLIDEEQYRQIHIVNAITGDYLTSYGNKGQGPGEFLGPWKIDFLPHEHTFWVYDITLKRLTLLSLDSILTNDKYISHNTITIPEGFSINELVQISDSMFVGGLIQNEYRLLLFNKTGSYSYAFGDYPAIDNKYNLSLEQYAKAQTKLCQGELFKNFKNRKFAMMTRSVDQVDIYDFTGDLDFILWGPDQTLLSYNYKGRAVIAKGNISGYRSMCLTDRFIYAHYCGKPWEPFEPSSSFGNKVFKFDYEGRLLDEYVLDKDVLYIAVDEKRQKLYSLRPYDDYPIRQYALEGS